MRDFMRAVYETRAQRRGVAPAVEVMRHMGLRASSIADLAHNPTTEDDKTYTRLARYCEREQGYIKGMDDRYLSVRITYRGRRYAEKL